jgi:hypothetical protein
MADSLPKYSLIGGIVFAVILIVLGYHFVRVARNDKEMNTCNSEWYLKIIGWIIVIWNVINVLLGGYMLYRQ